jgi:hypothetical protein
MGSECEAIFEAALKLPENELLSLVSRLLETVPDEPAGLPVDDADLIAELDRRVSDREGATPWRELRDQF